MSDSWMNIIAGKLVGVCLLGGAFVACAAGTGGIPSGIDPSAAIEDHARRPDVPAPSQEPTPSEKIEQLVRAHLQDPALRTCIEDVPGRAALQERVEFFLQARIGMDFNAAGHESIEVAVTEQFQYDKVGTCIGGVVSTWNVGSLGLHPGEEGHVAFVLVDDPKSSEMRWRVVREAPPERVPSRSAGALDRVAGSCGGDGFRDGAGPRARFDVPLGLAADGAGHLYVGDAENRAIRRIDLGPSAEVHTEVVAPGAEVVLVDGRRRTFRRQDLTQPSALAFDPRGRLHVLDTLTDNIWRWEGGHLVRIYEPDFRHPDKQDRIHGARAMAFDRGGTLFVCDSEAHRVVRIDLDTGKLTSVAGELDHPGHRDGGKARFNDPEGLALDGEGHLFVSEWRNHTIREITLSTGLVRTLAGRPGIAGHADGVGAAARFDAPSGLAYDRGNLYVAESGGLVVRRVDLSTGQVTTVAGSFHVRGAADGVGSAAHFGHHESSALGELPVSLALAGGDLYLTDSGNHVVRRIAPSTGEVTTVAGAALDERLPAPRALAFDRDGHLYFTAGQALYASPEGGAPRLLAGDPEEMGRRDGAGKKARFRGPLALNAGEDGTLYVAEVNGTIRRVDPQSGNVTTVTDLDALVDAMAADDHGNLYVSKLFEILKISPDGKRTVLVSAGEDPSAIYAPLHKAYGLLLDGDVLYVLDETASNLGPFVGVLLTLRRIDLQTRTEEGLASWSLPKRSMVAWPLVAGLSKSSDGALWIAHSDGVIVRFDPRTREEEAVVGGRSSEHGVVLGPQAELNMPSMPTVTRSGDLYFIDEGAVLRLRSAARPRP